jgi:hypothetical protein
MTVAVHRKVRGEGYGNRADLWDAAGGDLLEEGVYWGVLTSDVNTVRFRIGKPRLLRQAKAYTPSTLQRSSGRRRTLQSSCYMQSAATAPPLSTCFIAPCPSLVRNVVDHDHSQ